MPIERIYASPSLGLAEAPGNRTRFSCAARLGQDVDIPVATIGCRVVHELCKVEGLEDEFIDCGLAPRPHQHKALSTLSWAPSRMCLKILATSALSSCDARMAEKPLVVYHGRHVLCDLGSCSKQIVVAPEQHLCLRQLARVDESRGTRTHRQGRVGGASRCTMRGPKDYSWEASRSRAENLAPSTAGDAPATSSPTSSRQLKQHKGPLCSLS